MKRIALTAAAIILPTAALAQAPSPPPVTFPVQISAQDTTSIRQVCDIARTSNSVNLETAGGIAQYCLGLIGRISAADADHKKATEAKPPEEPKK